MDSGTPNGNKSPQRRRGASTGAAQIVVLSDLQMPHMARVAEQPESRADSMLSDGISRAQLRASSKSISPAASSGTANNALTGNLNWAMFHYVDPLPQAQST
ncbi:hypothetical protein GGI07_005154 [Coemansia sp. Benny D115]|nr:hypothetical protein GGI07_005154 [Coemansia sp. Benny D115]